MIHACCSDKANVRQYPGRNNVECRICHTVWQEPQPDEEELARIYSADYYDSWAGQDGKTAYWDLKKTLAHDLLDRIPEAAGRLAVLDIGCATGACMSAIADKGWQPHGVDVNEHAVEQALKAVPNAVARVGTTRDFTDWAEHFDAIIMSDVIEHVRDPRAELRHVHGMLKSGGKVILLTPNIRSLSAFLMRGSWIHLKPEHLYYFSPKGLGRLAREVGFKIRLSKSARKPMTLAYAISQFRAYEHPLFTRVFTFLDRVLPKRIKETSFSIPMGEMLLILKKD